MAIGVQVGATAALLKRELEERKRRDVEREDASRVALVVDDEPVLRTVILKPA